MSPQNWTQLVLVLLGFALIASALGWLPAGRAVFAPAALALLAAAGLVAALPAALDASRSSLTALVAVSGAVAVVGGGPVTTRIFDVVDRTPGTSVVGAGAILRGGAWIGALERLAVFAGLAAGFPEGVAVVLALKGVGRYPDLKASDTEGATTERFIIGTFASVLWAAACAGMVALVQR